MDSGSWGTQKPLVGSVVNLGNSLQSGLSPCFILNEGSGAKLKDATARGIDSAVMSFAWSTSSGWVPGNNGPCLLFNGTSDCVKFTTRITAKPFTLGCVFSPVSLSATGTVMELDRAGNVDSIVRIVMSGTGGTGKINLNWVDSSTSQVNINGLNNLVAGGWYNAVAVIPVTGSASFYVNGVLQGTAATPTLNAFTNASLGVLRYSSDLQFYSGRIGSAFYWSRALLPSDVLAFSNNPYGIITPPAAAKFYSYAAPVTTLITFDAASNSGDQSAVSSVSFSVPWNGSNRMLAIDVPFMGAAGTVSSMTYGGATCTLVGARNVVGGTGRVEQWRICQNDSGAPAAGSNTLVVTYSGVIADTSVDCVSYTNVNQVSPTEAWNGNSGINAGSATDATVVVTSTTDNCWFHYAMASSQTSGMASSNTSRNIVTGAGGTGADADSNAVISPAGAQTGRWTGNGITSAWAVGGYAIKPYSSTIYRLPPKPLIASVNWYKYAE